MPSSSKLATGSFLLGLCLAWTQLCLQLRPALAASLNDGSDVHIMYLTDCKEYSDWQVIGMAFSFRQTQQPGQITRVMCCSDDERARYSKSLLEYMPTHVAPSYAWNPRTKDWYQAYNKPGAVVDFMARAKPKEDWVLVIDSDMLLLKHFRPHDFKLTKGWIISADYTYLKGVMNELWTRHIPQIAARNDTLAGPAGRHADQVGGFFFAHRDDMARIAPMWLNMTEEVREDPEAWRLTGDTYVKQGGRPWISEMYGYVYAAAKANVWHRWAIDVMQYPNYRPVAFPWGAGCQYDGLHPQWKALFDERQYQCKSIPRINHYGLYMDIGKPEPYYKWDKHNHFHFNVERCPPWDLTDDPKERKGGIFVPPPHPSELKSKNGNIQIDYYGDLLRVETVATLNAAFCDYHISHCPPSQQLLDVCTEALSLYVDVVRALNEIEPKLECRDLEAKCHDWVKSNECVRNFNFMKWHCPKACGWCYFNLDDAQMGPRREPTETLHALERLRANLTGKGKAPAPDKQVVHGGKPGSDETAQATAKSDTSQPKHVHIMHADTVEGAKTAKTDADTAEGAEPAKADSDVVTAADGKDQQAAGSGKGAESHRFVKGSRAELLRMLLRRCYDMEGLSSTQLQECARMASRGKKWEAVDAGDEADNDVKHQVGTQQGTEGKDEGGEGIADLPTQGHTSHSHVAALMELGTAHTLILWGLILAALVVGARRLVMRRRRRQRTA